MEIRRDDGRAPIMALAEDLEEELGAGVGERHIAKFVDDEQSDSSKLGLDNNLWSGLSVKMFSGTTSAQ
jgi:hypothetical protein